MLRESQDNPYENLRVLVLEDELHIRKIIIRLLKQIGVRLIAEASDGAEGFKELLRVSPDIILCDIHMSPIDGMTFLAKIRALNHEVYSKLPVIFLTADSERDTVINAKRLHVDGYLTKPVSMKAIQDRLDHVLEKV